MLDMNKHIVKSDDDQPFHTSGYAVAANGGRIGAVSTLTFEQRQQMAQNRKTVNSYTRSAIGNTYSKMRAQSVEPSAIANRAQASVTSKPIVLPPRQNSNF